MSSHTQSISELSPLTRRRRNMPARAEDPLSAGDAVYRACFDASGIAMAVISPDGRIAAVNPAVCQMLGWPSSALIDSHLGDLVSIEHRARYNRQLEVLDARPHDSVRLTVDFSTHRDDRLRCLLNLSALTDAAGKTTRLLAQFQEIGSLIQSPIEMDAGRKHFKALSDITFEAVLISQNGTCIDANRTAAEMLGIPLDTIIGMPTAELFDPRFRQTVRKKMRTGCETAYRAMALRRDGTRFHVIVQGKMVVIGDRTVRVSVVRDIDAQIRTEAALRESERHLRSLLESASNFVLFRFRDNLENPCKPAQVLISPSIHEIIDSERVYDFQTFLATFHPDDRQRLLDALIRLRDSKRMDIRGRVQDRAGKGWRWLHIIAVAVSEIDGDTIFYNGIILDITGEMAATAALKKREAELKERTESLSEVNTALEVLLRKREADRMDVEEKILNNARSLILPYLDKLKASRLDERQRVYLNLVESNLNEIISPLTQRMSRHYMNFTPMEIQVANLVKEGRTTKDIAFILGLSTRTIEAVRYGVRRKLGLKKRTNLRTYLLSIDGGQAVTDGKRSHRRF